MTPDPTTAVLADISAERMSQEEKFPGQVLPTRTGPLTTPMLPMVQVYSEELRGIFRRKVDTDAAKDHVTFPAVLLREVFTALAESNPQRVRDSLVRVAALCVRQVEAIDRNGASVGSPDDVMEKPHG